MFPPGFSLARMRALMLSLYIVAMNINFFRLVNLSPFVTRRGIAARQAWNSVVYSDYMVLVAIIVCMVDTHNTGQLAISMIYPVLHLTQSGFTLYSTPLPQTKRYQRKHQF